MRALLVGCVLVGAFVVAPLLSPYLPTGAVAFGSSRAAPRSATAVLDPAVGTETMAPARDAAPALVSVAPPEEPPGQALPLWVDHGQPVAITWYHPLAAPRRLPDRPDRRFGAARDGGRPECGLGHCGVDLGHRAGLVVHAARAGTVVRIVTDPDRKGGRYVKLAHEGGYFTYYFHLDRIHPAMVVGIEVAAGDPIGTTGHSGIKHSGPHLHFAVTRLRPDGSEEYLDPEPMLRRATLLDRPAPFPPVTRLAASGPAARRGDVDRAATVDDGDDRE